MAASLSSLLADKLKADGLSLAAAAKTSGISLPSLRAVLKATSTPNARSIGKYASFLGLSADEAASMAASSKGSTKRKGKPGRKPGPKPGKAKGKPGRKPGATKGKPGRKPRSGASAALATVSEALKAAEMVLGDELALKVAGLSKKARATLAAIIDSL